LQTPLKKAFPLKETAVDVGKSPNQMIQWKIVGICLQGTIGKKTIQSRAFIPYIAVFL